MARHIDIVTADKAEWDKAKDKAVALGYELRGESRLYASSGALIGCWDDGPCSGGWFYYFTMAA